MGLIANMGYRFYAHNLHRFYHCDWPEIRGAARPMAVPEAAGSTARCG